MKLECERRSSTEGDSMGVEALTEDEQSFE